MRLITLVSRILKWFGVSLISLAALVLAGGRNYQVVSESGDLARYPAPGELVSVHGHLMHINCIGEGSPTVIIELGVGSAAAAWHDIHKQISQSTTACAYDRAGLGYSEPTEEPARSADVARRLHDLMRQAKITDEIVLVGWSAGGVYVREFFRRYPESVRAMLLVESSHEQQASRLPESSGGGSDPMLVIARYLAPFGLVRMAGILDRRIDAGAGSDEQKARLKVVYHRSHVLGTVLKESAAFDLDASATQPPSPMGNLPLIVLTAGKSVEPSENMSPGADLQLLQEEKRVRSELQTELAMLSSNSEQIIATGSGHNIHAEQPELVVESVAKLVQAVREQRQSSDAASH